MIETLLISGGIVAATAVGVKLGLLKREASEYMDQYNREAPTMAKVFRAQADIDQMYLRAAEQICQAEWEARQ